MFCPSCGNQLPDGAQFCGSCGNKLLNASAPAQPRAAAVHAAKKGLSPIIIIGIVVAAVLLVGSGTGLISLFGGGLKGAEKLVLKNAEAVMSCDIAASLDCYPDEVVDFFVMEYGKSSEKELLSSLETYLDDYFVMIEEASGVDLKSAMKKIDIKVTDSSELSESELETLRYSWNVFIPGFGDRIEQAAKVSLSYSIKQDPEFQFYDASIKLSDLISDSGSYLAVKIDGTWYCLSSGLQDFYLF